MLASIREIIAFIHADPELSRIRDQLENTDDAAHDLHHSLRVALWTLHCADGQVDSRIAVAAALCHDLVNLPKNSPDRHRASELSAEGAKRLLDGAGFTATDLQGIVDAVRTHSYSRGEEPMSLLGEALQDADRLEAVGAIGILRTAAVGARLGAKLFEPEDPFASTRLLDDRAFTIDHFFTKLLGLYKTMKTPRGRTEAQRRTAIVHRFLVDLSGELGVAPPAPLETS